MHGMVLSSLAEKAMNAFRDSGVVGMLLICEIRISRVHDDSNID